MQIQLNDMSANLQKLISRFRSNTKKEPYVLGVGKVIYYRLSMEYPGAENFTFAGIPVELIGDIGEYDAVIYTEASYKSRL